ncbi:hypothetical protein AALI21_02890 [Corynebacteriaceae bacterium 6-324]
MSRSQIEVSHVKNVEDFIQAVESVKQRFGYLPKSVLDPLDGAVDEATGHKANIEALAGARSIMKKGKSREDS